jgi:hypothetical protein
MAHPRKDLRQAPFRSDYLEIMRDCVAAASGLEISAFLTACAARAGSEKPWR